LNFLAANGFGGILADEMGLGKTVQTLAFLRNSSGLRLIVCPSSLVYNWEREAGRFVPELRVLPVTGSKRSELFKKINDVDLVITSYPLLRRDIEEYRTREFAAVVLDEAQQIKNPDSLNAQAAMALRASTRFALTGTPVENAVRDIWSIMNFLMPGYLGNRGDFKERYEQALNAGGEGAIAAQQRLARRLRPFLLRRTKKLVAKELPDKIEQITYCELTESQRALYEEVSTAVRREVTRLTGEKDKNKARMVMLTALLRLRQTCCDLRLLGLEKPPDEAACSAKLDLLEELLQEALDGGHRVLVFSQFSTMLGLIKKRLESSDIAHCYLDGGTKNRQAEVDRFQAGEAPVFLISLKAGGTGLTLTAADTVVHFDPWWNPAVEAQATDRAHRIGQKKVVTVYKLIARGTVEEKVLKLQEKKKAVIAATVENEQPMMEGLTMSEIESLLD
jgi:SNF2 family DNA or RNA helicase